MGRNACVGSRGIGCSLQSPLDKDGNKSKKAEKQNDSGVKSAKLLQAKMAAMQPISSIAAWVA